MASKLTWLVLALLIAAMQVHIANSRQLGGSSSGSSILSNPELQNPNRDEKKVVAELLISRIAAESPTEQRVAMPLEDDSGPKLAATRPTKRALSNHVRERSPPPPGNPINSP
jgi:hypothetical protein